MVLSDDGLPGAPQVLPLHAEQLSVAKRQATRTVLVRRETRTRDAVVQEDLTNTGVVIERVPMGTFVDAIPPVREEGDYTILPVVEEVIVTERRLRLVEEVRIRRVQTTATHVETIRLREQHVTVTRPDPVTFETPDSLGRSPAATAYSDTATRRASMSAETIVAVYDTAAHAEQVIADLLAASVPQSSIHRHAAEGSYSADATSVTTRRTDEPGGFWSSLFGGSSDDHAVYDRTVESGGNVVSVAAVPEHDYEAVMAILEKHNPVDIDERASTYGSMASVAPSPSTTMSSGSAVSGAAGMATTGIAADADTIRLAEEQLVVGKRLVNRGGTRVRRYIVETPVEESISLHEEHVTLERHPVTDGRQATDADFSEKTIELTETAEEAVVSKTARVVEEVRLGKTSTDRTETIHDTVRKEEVEVEQLAGTAAGSTQTSGTYTPKV